MGPYDDLASLMPSASPLASAGIDPDDAVANREQVMAQLAAKQAGLVHPVANTSGIVPESVAAPAPWTPSATPPATNAPTPPSEPTSTASVPGSVTPSGNNQTSPDYYQQGQAGALSSAQDAQTNARRWQSRPLPSATTDPLEAARLKASIPTPETGPDGKLLPQYRPSVGQRIARGVAGFAQNGLRGVLTAPYGAPTDAYSGQENARQAQLASIDQQMKYRQGANTADQTAMKDIGANDNATGSRFSAIANGAVAKQNADTSGQNAATTAARETREANAPAKIPTTYEAAVIAANQETDPAKKASLMAAANQIQGAEVRRFQAAAPRGNAANSQVPTPTGPLSPAAKAVIDGRTKLPPANSRNPDAQALRKEVFANAPDYDESAYPNYAKLRGDFTSGTEARTINFISTASRHLDELEKHIPDNVDIPVIGSAINWAKNSATRATSPELKAFEDARSAVSSEVAKAYAGKAITQGEHDEMMQLINENDSPKAIKAAAGEFRNLLEGKKQGLVEQWNSGMPKGAVNPLSTLPGSNGGGNATDQNAPPPGAKVRDYTSLGPK